jgi:hypothetical protein
MVELGEPPESNTKVRDMLISLSPMYLVTAFIVKFIFTVLRLLSSSSQHNSQSSIEQADEVSAIAVKAHTTPEMVTRQIWTRGGFTAEQGKVWFVDADGRIATHGRYGRFPAAVRKSLSLRLRSAGPVTSKSGIR